MITKWKYTQRHKYTTSVKNYISENNLTAVDVGASVYNWSYPECKVAVDLSTYSPVHTPDLLLFNINLDNSVEWEPLLKYVEINGKFDFSICSHTLEDVMFPYNTVKLLTLISKQGYIAVPSKFEELRRRENAIRGYMHHKQFFDVIDNKLCLFPKLTLIEHDVRADDVANKWDSEIEDLIVYWQDDIPITYFPEGRVFMSDDALSNEYFNTINITTPEHMHVF